MIRNKYIRKSAYKTEENEPKYLGCLDCKFKWRCTLNKGSIYIHPGLPETCIVLKLKVPETKHSRKNKGGN